ncbi:DUF5988 family protein [Streptomyces sp. NPDC058008]|uniref:DUF5988 family protein n=1 Tax=Streptomyces sp. NPDC058008 TaxID=3346303 RepID=UPI0036E6DB84
MRRDESEEDVEVLLTGGPDGTPERWAVSADALADRVAVRHLNGREHFEATDDCIETDGHSTPVYRWIYSTKIAE